MSAMHDPFIFVGIGVGMAVAALGELLATFLPIRRSKWIEPTDHDIGLLPGGQVIHYTSCWCKQKAERNG